MLFYLKKILRNLNAAGGVKLSRLLKRKLCGLRSDDTVTLVACARDEGPYLLEWVCYHKLLGIDNIIIYSHDNHDKSELLLQKLSDAGVIEYHDFTGKIPEDIGIQCHIYMQAFENVKSRMLSKWMLAIDIDEFLVLKNHDNIKQFIRSFPKQTDAIVMSWEMFNANKKLRTEEGLTTELFTRLAYPQPQIKTMAKVSALRTWDRPHLPPFYSYIDSTILYPDFTKHSLNGAYYCDKNAVVNHYITKSYEEFLIKKYRGTGLDKGVHVHEPRSNRSLTYFMQQNAPQKEENKDILRTQAYQNLKPYMAELRQTLGLGEVERDIFESYKALGQRLLDSSDEDTDSEGSKARVQTLFQSLSPMEDAGKFVDKDFFKNNVVYLLRSNTIENRYVLQRVRNHVKREALIEVRGQMTMYLEQLNFLEAVSMAKDDLKIIISPASYFPVSKELPDKQVNVFRTISHPLDMVVDKYNQELERRIQYNKEPENRLLMQFKSDAYFEKYVTQDYKPMTLHIKKRSAMKRARIKKSEVSCDFLMNNFKDITALLNIMVPELNLRPEEVEEELNALRNARKIKKEDFSAATLRRLEAILEDDIEEYYLVIAQSFLAQENVSDN